jgi:purine-nucleoside phosphorylase
MSSRGRSTTADLESLEIDNRRPLALLSGVTDDLTRALDGVRSRMRSAPEAAIVLGSGLGEVVGQVEEPTTLPYGAIPGMPSPSVQGHGGELVLGRLGGRSVVILRGRVHLYEGRSPDDVVFGVRLAIRLGARTIVLTNAAGGIADPLLPGSLMRITDHLNLTGRSPLVGDAAAELGERFVDLGNAYDPELGARVDAFASEASIDLHRGVYAGLLGPSYETPAEIRMLRALGADAVGMSTVLETIAARQLGARVVGVSCITNRAAGLSDERLSHEEVQRVGRQAQRDFGKLLVGVMGALS